MDEQFQQQFATRLRQERLKQGLSQAELAERIGWVKPGSISQWETGRALPRVDHLYKLAQVLWCSVDWLLGSEKVGQTKIEHGCGFHWRITRPQSQDARHKQMLERGILLLQRLTVEGQTLAKIRSSTPFSGYSLTQLLQLLDTVLLSRTVELIDVDRDHQAEQQLTTRYQTRLLHCLVAAVQIEAEPQFENRLRTEAIAFLAAQEAVSRIPPRSSVALTGGRQISRMVDLIPPVYPGLAGTTWLPLLRSKLPPTAKTDYNSPNSVIARIVQRQPGTQGYRLPFVTMHQRKTSYLAQVNEQERPILQHAAWVLEKAQDCNVAFLAVHSSQYGHRLTDALEGLPDLQSVLVQYSRKERTRYIGNILLYLIDKNGRRIGNKVERLANDEIVYSIGLDGLRNITHNGTVWLTAEMAHKAPVVRAALHAGLANSLIIDTTVARQLLAQD